MKAFFVDMTLCTACRGCQVACKQWKNLPAEETHNWGSHQNPKELTGNTYKLVHFKEIPVEGATNRVDWVFFPEQCRHCYDPPCIYAFFEEGSAIHDEETGAVLFTDITKLEDYESARSYCPYDIPRQREDGVITKCDMCIDRVRDNKLPACVQTCPTGAMKFGDEKEIYDYAQKRLAEVLPKYPKAELADPDSVRVIYLFPYPALEVYEKAIASVEPMNRRNLLASIAGKSRLRKQRA